MRELIGRGRRALVAGTVAGSACLLVGLTPGTVSSAAPSVPGLPVEAKGLLGTLDTSAGVHKLVFDTSAGRYSLDGVKSDVDDRRAIRMADGKAVPVFDFDALRLGPSTAVSVRGKNPLILLSKGDASIATPLRLDGKPGADNGRGAGGGGGGGGGAVAIFSKGTLTVADISVNGGPGGVGNAAWSPIHGGDGGAGGVTLVSAKTVELTGAISALSGGKTGNMPGSVVVIGPVAHGAKAAVNGLPAAHAPALQAMPGIAKGTLLIAGGSGGGGGGGTGLPEKVTPDFVKTKSAGGLAGPGGLAGGAGAYAVAGGAGGAGGLGLISGGGGGGGGAYGGPGGARGLGGVDNGALGGAGGAGVCPAAGVPGGPGGAGGPTAPGGAGGAGGTSVGGNGANGFAGGFGGGGGGGGGGADGCKLPTPIPPGKGGTGGAGGPAAQPGQHGGAGAWLPAGGGAVLDADGVDVDAACQIGDPTKLTNAPPNYIKSPGSAGGTWTGGDGCDGISSYDGSTESTDFKKVTLSTNGLGSAQGPHSNTQVTATFNVDGTIPAPCSVPAAGCTPAAADLPDASFVGFGYRAMFQNLDRQTNTPYIAATRITGGAIFGLNEHWGDGFHDYIGFSANFTGANWLHSAEVGVYDPGPDGAFFFTELGTSTSPGVWNAADACMPYGTNASGGTWDVAYTGTNQVAVTVDGVSRFSNIQAVGNCINDESVKANDRIVNIKGLATADSTVVLPVTIPLSIIPGESDITSVGGFLFTSDYTDGNSRNVGIVGTALEPNRVGLPASGGFLGLVDTLGDGPRCWTSTVGGVLPSNPLWVPNQPCYIDDDVVPGPTGNVDPGLGRGSILEEWWDTNYGITA